MMCLLSFVLGRDFSHIRGSADRACQTPNVVTPVAETITAAALARHIDVLSQDSMRCQVD
jgi:hypothetical protein